MRTSIRRPAVLAATAMAAMSLTLTACGGADAAKDKSAPAPAAASDAKTGGGAEKEAAAGSGAEQEQAGTGTSVSDTGDSTGTAKKASAKKRAGTKAATPACAVGDVNISAAKQEGVPTTHITLTAKNTSGRSCTLLQYPVIAFGDIHTAKDVPPVAKSKPATAIVLTPGAPAYAAVRINGGGVDEDTRAVTSFYVNLFATDGPAEGSKGVKAPKGGISVTDAIAKTGYWTYELRNGADDF